MQGNCDGVQREQSAQPHLIITVTDAQQFTLRIAGQYPSLDYALNMLDQARRELDALWRLQRAQATIQQAANQQLTRDLMRTR